jgi:Domain of unknown function (DUF4124)
MKRAAKRRIVVSEGMPPMDATKLSTACLTALVLGIAPAASAAVATVYKCFDRQLNVVYTDQPCGGEKLDIELGRVDQNAVAELAREREALSRAVAQRIADNRRYPVAAADYIAGPPPADGSEIYYPAGWGYYAPYAIDRGRGRGHHFGGGDANRARMGRSVPAIPPNGLTNRTLR